MEGEKVIYTAILTLLLTFALILTTMSCSNQTTSGRTFVLKVDSIMKTKLNVIKIPDSFNKCAERMYAIGEKAGKEKSVIASQIAKKCLYPRIQQFKFSDNGLEMLKFGKKQTIKKCVNYYTGKYNSVLNVKEYCKCIYVGYLKHKIGTEIMASSKFKESGLNKKIIRNCASKSRKSNK